MGLVVEEMMFKAKKLMTTESRQTESDQRVIRIDLPMNLQVPSFVVLEFFYNFVQIIFKWIKVSKIVKFIEFVYLLPLKKDYIQVTSFLFSYLQLLLSFSCFKCWDV